MGLRDDLRRSLTSELHRCTPYAVQPCNYGPPAATVDATLTQQNGVGHREAHATVDATAVQPLSCTAVADRELGGVEAQQEAYEERAAIREHDAELPRSVAERQASVDILRLSRADANECHAGGWTEPEIATFIKRRSMMLARGYASDDSEAIAEALTLRDRQGDDRRICLECTHLGERGRCLAASAGRIPGAARRLEPVPTILQRCEGFGLRKGLV